MSVRESFNPESYELDKNFRLTRFAELKGTGCKVGSPYHNIPWMHCCLFIAIHIDKKGEIKLMLENCVFILRSQVPQDVLQKLLETLQENHYQEDEQFLGAVMPRLGNYGLHIVL